MRISTSAIGIKTDLKSLLHLESLTGVSRAGVGSETFSNSSLEESLDKWTRSLGHSSFTEWRRDGWILEISKGCNKRSMDAAIRIVVSPNALYHLRGSTQY